MFLIVFYFVLLFLPLLWIHIMDCLTYCFAMVGGVPSAEVDPTPSSHYFSSCVAPEGVVYQGRYVGGHLPPFPWWQGLPVHTVSQDCLFALELLLMGWDRPCHLHVWLSVMLWVATCAFTVVIISWMRRTLLHVVKLCMFTYMV